MRRAIAGAIEGLRRTEEAERLADVAARIDAMVTEDAPHPNVARDEDDRYLTALGGSPQGLDRVKAAELSRLQFMRHPMGRSILRNIAAYVVGAAVRVRADLGEDYTEAQQEELQAEIDRWARSCRITARWWRGLLMRYLTDGEIGIRFVPGPGGVPRPIVEYTVGWDQAQDVETGDVVALVRKVPGGADVRYRVLNSLSQDDQDADYEILWWARDSWALGCWQGEKRIGGRGVPEATPLLSRLRWEDETVRLTVQRVKSMLRWFWNAIVKGATKDQLAEWNKSYSSAPATGTVRWTNDQVEWKAVNAELGAYETNAALRSLRGSIAGGAGQPLHWHGDGGDANLATATAMGEPAFRQLEQVQGDFVEIVEDVMAGTVAGLQAAGRVSAVIDPGDVRWALSLPRIDSRDYERGTRSLLTADTAIDSIVDSGYITWEAGQRIIADVTQRVLGVEITGGDFGTQPEVLPLPQRNPPVPGLQDEPDPADRDVRGAAGG